MGYFLANPAVSASPIRISAGRGMFFVGAAPRLLVFLHQCRRGHEKPGLPENQDRAARLRHPPILRKHGKLAIYAHRH